MNCSVPVFIIIFKVLHQFELWNYNWSFKYNSYVDSAKAGSNKNTWNVRYQICLTFFLS